ncbi:MULTISPECIES: hypothetical protein [Sphingobacterium]|uniref:hypothetical protein n=1 Tax=Sphingobacterium TaxID=28453 RepID=UPI001961075C|nr:MULTISPECIES: hypothetical protein [Sphingobacterium]QRQ62393.1 hypothetical protein I6J33_05270 [Sphingobacterium multivorum]
MRLFLGSFVFGGPFLFCLSEQYLTNTYPSSTFRLPLFDRSLGFLRVAIGICSGVTRSGPHENCWKARAASGLAWVLVGCKCIKRMVYGGCPASSLPNYRTAPANVLSVFLLMYVFVF